MSKVQQLEVWVPGEMELTLFCIYSPIHALLWMATTSANWMLMFLVMGGAGLQVSYSQLLVNDLTVFRIQMQVVTRSYQALIKDKEILAAEVMHEYNQGVSPLLLLPLQFLTSNS